jgi:hypothetical protein
VDFTAANFSIAKPIEVVSWIDIKWNRTNQPIKKVDTPKNEQKNSDKKVPAFLSLHQISIPNPSKNSLKILLIL